MKTLAKLLHWKPRPRLAFRALTNSAQLPTYATDGAAGMDLYADEDTVIPFLKRGLVKTNVSVDLPPGIEAQVRARSGLALKKGIMVLNGPGTIDPDYSGGIGVILFNTDMEDFVVRRGDRIAQLVIASFVRVRPVFTNAEPARESARGAAGFGSTGTGALAAGGLAMAALTPGAQALPFQSATVIDGSRLKVGVSREEMDAEMEKAIAEGLAAHDAEQAQRREREQALMRRNMALGRA